MRRRDLLTRIPLFLAAVRVIGCVEVDDYPVRGGGVPVGDTGGGERAESFVVTNDDDSGHTHTFEVQCVDLDRSEYTFVAEGAHTHQVTITADDFERVLEGDTVRIETTAGHPHVWVIRMPAGLC